MPIQRVKARQIFDSRGDPTLEVDVITDIGLLRSSVPSERTVNPASAAVELRDGNEAIYGGKSVFKAVDVVNNVIGPALIKSRLEACQQQEIDALLARLDGTENKSKLGANSILGVSIACCKAGAVQKGVPLYKYIADMVDNTEPSIPIPAFNLISGGKAAGNLLPCQEFMILPIGAVSFADAMKMGTEVYRTIEKTIAETQEAKLPLPVGEEGTFVPEFEEDREALSVITEGIKSAGYDGKIKIAIDMAATSFCKDGMYDLAFKSEDSDPDDYLEAEALRDQYMELLAEFPLIVSIEDPFDQEDWEGWPMMADQPIQIVADELTSMNIERIEEATEKRLANCLLLRMSEIGTVTETINCHRMAKLYGWESALNVGNAETEDNFVADLAVGLSVGQFKAGAPCRTDRIAKYNHLLRIEEELGKDAKYAGNKFPNYANKQ